MRADGPKEIVRGDGPDQEALRAAKAEVAAELAAAKRVGPRVRGEVALIRFASPTQVHPLVAQAWRGRLPDKIVIAANEGYREGWVHFAARTATGTNLVDWFGARRPEGAGAHYGSGHAAASGGALTPAQWRAFLNTIGFEDAA
jgi:single-stranded-DNA-specific exonuclease